MLGLKRKWSELCQANHPSMFGQNLAEKRYTCTSRHPWCSSSSPPCNQNSAKLLESAQELIGISSSSGNDSSECQARNESKLRFCESKDVRTTLALASPLFSDSATSENQREGLVANPQELCQRLQEDITWQSEIIPSMVESLLDSISSEKRCTCLLIRGTDHIGKRKLAKTISEILYGSTQSVIYINMKKTTGIAFPSAGTILETLKRDPKRVFLIEDVDQAHNDFLENLAKNIKKIGFECPAIFIFTTTPTSTNTNFNRDKVLQMKMKIEEPKIDEDQEYELWNKSKKIRQEKTTDLDLNISVVAEEDDSGLTQEVEDQGFGLSPEFLELIGLHFTFNAGSDWYERVIESFSMKLHRFFEDVQSDKGDNEWSFSVDKRVLEGLVEASDMVMERWFEEWLREVFKRSLLLFKKGGKVRLSIDRGKEGNAMEGGFEGSLLPSRIHVDLDE